MAVNARDGSRVLISVTLGTSTSDLKPFDFSKTIWSPGDVHAGTPSGPTQQIGGCTGPAVSQWSPSAPVSQWASGAQVSQWSPGAPKGDDTAQDERNSFATKSELGASTGSSQELRLTNLRSELSISDTVERSSTGSNTDTSSPENEPDAHVTKFDGKSGMPAEVTSQPWRIPEYMTRNSDCPEILVQSCVALELAVKTKGVADRTVQAGAVEEIIKCLHRHRSHAQLQEAGLWILWVFAAAKKEYRSRLIAAGATGVVITAMQTHVNVAGVQEQGLWCIYWLTSDCLSNKARVVSLAGCELIQRAYATHASQHKSIKDFAPVCLASLQNKSPASLCPAS